MTNKTTPCRIVVRPVPNDNILVNSDKISNSVDFVSIPSVTENPVITDTIATAGIVRPMLASAEPRARLRLVCNLFFLAALNAATPSGNKITRATIIPTMDFGAPNCITPRSTVGASVLASNTTAPRQSNNSNVLAIAVFFVGGSA